MAHANLNGFKMSYDVHPGLVPMDTVFMHGNLSSNTWWQPALELWKKQASPANEGRLIFAEWRGCGKSDAPKSESELHPKALASDYIALLRELGVKKANIVGHSTGGLIALYALLQAPELFHRVVLLDSVAATGIQFGKEMFDAFTQMSQDRTFCAAVMGGTIYGNDPQHPLFEKIIDESFGVAKEIWHGIPNVLRDIDLRSELKNIQHPVLVLHGEHDNLLPREGSIFLGENLPNGRFEEIKGQGHSTNFENPEKFVSIVSGFLFERN